MYVDGHFCYACKIDIITNDLGIVRHLDLYNKDFLVAHPELVPIKKSDCPNEDKPIHHFKDSFGLAGGKTQNEKTLHADLILAGIT